MVVGVFWKFKAFGKKKRIRFPAEVHLLRGSKRGGAVPHGGKTKKGGPSKHTFPRQTKGTGIKTRRTMHGKVTFEGASLGGQKREGGGGGVRL